MRQAVVACILTACGRTEAPTKPAQPSPPPPTPVDAAVTREPPADAPLDLSAFAGMLGGAWGRGHEVWVVGATFGEGGSKEMPSFGLVLHSADDARTWQVVRRERPALRGMWGTGDTLIAVGSGILRSVDRGATWASVLTHGDILPTGTQLGAVTGHGRDVWAVGCAIGGFRSPGYVLRSRDTGATWAIEKRDLQGCPDTAMWTPNGREVYAIGTVVDEDSPRSLLLATHDGGATWRRHALPSNFDLRAIGTNRSDLYLQPTSGPAQISRDGGAHWAPVPTVPVPLFDQRTWQDDTGVHRLDVDTSTVTP